MVVDKHGQLGLKTNQTILAVLMMLKSLKNTGKSTRPNNKRDQKVNPLRTPKKKSSKNVQRNLIESGKHSDNIHQQNGSVITEKEIHKTETTVKGVDYSKLSNKENGKISGTDNFMKGEDSVKQISVTESQETENAPKRNQSRGRFVSKIMS